MKLIAIADGTYIYCENFGGFEGNKELFSGHTLRCLQKVMCFCTTRGYWVRNFAGYGGSGRYSDMELLVLDYIIEDLEGSLEADPNARNFLSFFNLTADAAKDHALIVDRGFEGASETYMTFLAPRGKAKSKDSGKTKVAKQHTPKQAALNRTVTRVRNIIERMFSATIKTWGVLGGRVLSFAYFEFTPEYMDIACAISNAFRGCLDEKQGVNDAADFETMRNRISHEHEILRILGKSPTDKGSFTINVRGHFDFQDFFNPPLPPTEMSAKKCPLRN